jgi:hypothetical protein
MAKKRTRPPSKPVAPKSNATAKKATAAPLVADPTIPEVEVQPRPSTRPPKVSRQQATIEQLKDEYSYVTKDLRRVFLLAALMFALLIVANLVLPLLGV